jgi:mannose-6-phosphate isomerase-like protein (cupin superfamily)
MKKYFKADLHNKHLVMVTTGYGAVVEPHTHDYFEMVYVLGGRAEQIICGSHYIISSGDYFLIDIGQDHEYRRASERELPIINVLFSPRLIDTGARPDVAHAPPAAQLQPVAAHQKPCGNGFSRQRRRNKNQVYKDA